MPRIRSFKPEMVDDEALGRCSIGAQLLFDRLIMHADDAGRYRSSGALLRGKLFPYRTELTDADLDAWVVELEAAALLTTYTVRGQRFLRLRSFGKHQRLDNAAKPIYPGTEEADVDAGSGGPPRDSAILREAPRTAAGEEGRGEEGSTPVRARASSRLGRGDEPVEVFATTVRLLGLSPPPESDLGVVSRKARNLLAAGKSMVDVLEACRRAATANQAGLLERHCGDAERDRLGVNRTDRGAREATPMPRQRREPIPLREPDWDAQQAGIASVGEVLRRMPTERRGTTDAMTHAAVSA